MASRYSEERLVCGVEKAFFVALLLAVGLIVSGSRGCRLNQDYHLGSQAENPTPTATPTDDDDDDDDDDVVDTPTPTQTPVAVDPTPTGTPRVRRTPTPTATPEEPAASIRGAWSRASSGGVAAAKEEGEDGQEERLPSRQESDKPQDSKSEGWFRGGGYFE